MHDGTTAPVLSPEPPTTSLAERRARRVELARAALGTKPRTNGALLLLLSLAAFVAFALYDSSVRAVLVLVGVLLLHECGHLVAMRLRRFSDLRMFFLPFFGAAVSGRKPGASAADHGLVALAGPLPGLVLALPLLALLPERQVHAWATFFGGAMPLVTEIVLMLALLNLLNLVPMIPFDGGRLFEAILFARWPIVETAFRTLAITALAWLAYTYSLGVLGVLAALLALTLPNHTRMAFAAARLGRARPLPPEPASLTDDDLVALHDAADGATTVQREPQRTRLLAANVTQIFDRAARRPATLLQTTALTLAWLAGIALGVYELVQLARATR